MKTLFKFVPLVMLLGPLAHDAGAQVGERTMDLAAFKSWLSSPLPEKKGKAVIYLNANPTSSAGTFMEQNASKVCSLASEVKATHQLFLVSYDKRFMRQLDAAVELLKQRGCTPTVIRIRLPGHDLVDHEEVFPLFNDVYPMHKGAEYYHVNWSAMHGADGAATRTFGGILFGSERGR